MEGQKETQKNEEELEGWIMCQNLEAKKERMSGINKEAKDE